MIFSENRCTLFRIMLSICLVSAGLCSALTRMRSASVNSALLRAAPSETRAACGGVRDGEGLAGDDCKSISQQKRRDVGTAFRQPQPQMVSGGLGLELEALERPLRELLARSPRS